MVQAVSPVRSQEQTTKSGVKELPLVQVTQTQQTQGSSKRLAHGKVVETPNKAQRGCGVDKRHENPMGYRTPDDRQRDPKEAWSSQGK